MRIEVQKLTVPCPVNGNLAKVEVRCEVLDREAQTGQERRALKEIVTCTFSLRDSNAIQRARRRSADTSSTDVSGDGCRGCDRSSGFDLRCGNGCLRSCLAD